MKEIGEKLKETRESMGISIEEAATDLKIRPSQIENIEDGDKDAFKDIFYLKMFIKNYSKYLGLDYDKMLEEVKLDAIIVETGADIHAEFCAKAVEKNINVLTDIPKSPALG